jgi:hypothetical protein
MEQENNEAWSWFLKNLLDDIGSVKDNGWTFISDRQKVCIFLVVFLINFDCSHCVLPDMLFLFFFKRGWQKSLRNLCQWQITEYVCTTCMQTSETKGTERRH